MMEDREGARDASFFPVCHCWRWVGTTGEQPGLETPLGHPQSQYNEGCWAPRENSPSLEAFLTFSEPGQAHPAHQKHHFQVE